MLLQKMKKVSQTRKVSKCCCQVDDDVVDCQTIQEEKCESITQGYSTEQKCTKWPKQTCKQVSNFFHFNKILII